jgi:hypothetical protein
MHPAFSESFQPPEKRFGFFESDSQGQSGFDSLFARQLFCCKIPNQVTSATRGVLGVMPRATRSLEFISGMARGELSSGDVEARSVSPKRLPPALAWLEAISLTENDYVA